MSRFEAFVMPPFKYSSIQSTFSIYANSEAIKLISEVVSSVFLNKATEAYRMCKFIPPEIDGSSTNPDWLG